MKKSYKGYIVWMILFCVGMVLMMIVDLKNLKLFSLILGNYMLMMITLLTGMIYKNEFIGIQEFLIKKQLRQQVCQEKSMLINILYVFL